MPGVSAEKNLPAVCGWVGVDATITNGARRRARGDGRDGRDGREAPTICLDGANQKISACGGRVCEALHFARALDDLYVCFSAWASTVGSLSD